MSVSARSFVAAGVAARTAGVIAIPATVDAPASPSSSVQKERVALLAAARSFTAPIEPPAAFLVLTPPHDAPPNSTPGSAVKTSPRAMVAAAAPSAQAALAGLPGIQNAIINAYNVINPWIDYGVNLAQYAVGWIPVVGIFAPQIGIFYYNLIEPITTSAVYNIAYVLGGTIGLGQGISNVINDSINAGIGFVNAEINWALSFLPPLPPFPFAAAKTTALTVTAQPTAPATTEAAAGTVPVKHEAGAATSAEPEATKPPSRTSTESATPKPASEVSQPEPDPVTAKPETEPEKKPEATTTDSAGGIAAQGEVRGGTQSATDEKKPDEKAPASKPDKADGDAPSASTPAESSPDADKSGADKSAGSAHGA
jgi:hypothetical protein